MSQNLLLPIKNDKIHYVSMHRCARPVEVPYDAWQIDCFFSAVKVVKWHISAGGLFDLHCWHFNNTTCHQSSFQPKEQLTSNLSPLLPCCKVGALNFGSLTAFQKRIWGRWFWVTDILDVWEWGERQIRWWLVSQVLIIPSRNVFLSVSFTTPSF